MTSFWRSEGGAIVFFVAIACICMPIAYVGVSIESQAAMCIGCEAEAMALGHNIGAVLAVVMAADLFGFITYLYILFGRANVRQEQIRKKTYKDYECEIMAEISEMTNTTTREINDRIHP